jgi:hypothetical protein
MAPVRYAASPESDKKGRAALTTPGSSSVRKEEKNGRGGKRQDGGYQGAAAARALLAEQQASWSGEEKTDEWWGNAHLAKGRTPVFQDQSLARARWWVGRGERGGGGGLESLAECLPGRKTSPKNVRPLEKKIAPVQQ